MQLDHKVNLSAMFSFLRLQSLSIYYTQAICKNKAKAF